MFREQFERLGYHVALSPYDGASHFATDAEGRRGSVDLQQGRWLLWGEPPCWRSVAQLEKAATTTDPRQRELDQLCSDVRRRWPALVVDLAYRHPQFGNQVICTDERTGCQFVATSLDEVEARCGAPEPVAQRSLF